MKKMFVVAASFSASAAAAPPAYQSTFDGYRKFEDVQTGNWRKANDEVEKIGGWLSYLRQAQAELKVQNALPAAAQPAASPNRDSAPEPAPDAKYPDPHAGHGPKPAGNK